MNDTASKPGDDAGSLEFTRSIRKLSIKADTVDDAFDDTPGTALLLCRDGGSRKWGPKWLSQVAFQASVPSDPSNALELVRSTMPDIVFVEALLTDAAGEPLYKSLLDAADVTSKIVVLCNGSREISAALTAGAFDVACKPYEWQAISHRARTAMRLKQSQESLAESTTALSKALELANNARETLRSQQSFEPVTGLPNKNKFIDLLRRGMRAMDKDSGALAVIVVGFTRFRLVIEAMGQEQADQILTEIGQTLSACLRSTPHDSESGTRILRTAAVATLDQFRFGLMLTHSGDEDELSQLRQQLMDALSRPIQIAGQTVHLSACLGLALYPNDADDVDSLLQRADNAMRDAQSRGGGFKYYCTETDAAAARKLRIEHLLHEALDRDELSVAYQPIVDIESGAVIAAEALLRWRQADGTVIAPDEFVEVAEESGLMIRTGEFILNEACRQFREWHEHGLKLPLMCVNVSKIQLLSGAFPRTVRRVLEAHDMDPAELELEISERGVLSGDYDVISQLHELKALGVRLSVDDFGTGESAIAYLKELPVDVMKIDRSYVAGMIKDRKDAAIASAMVALAQRLDLAVIAEGVETEAQLEQLRELRCDAYQGFLYSEAVDADTFVSRAK